MLEKPLEIVEIVEIGDSVQLKSGGPIMTVTGIDLDKGEAPIDVKVQWFGTNDELKTEYFPPAALIKPTNSTETA